MAAIFQDILATLTTFPGNLTYHLVLAFAITGALFSAFNHWRNSEFPQSQRMVIGLGLLLGLRLAYFGSTALAWQGAQASFEFLPPLDRAITALSLIVIIWLWVFPEPSPESNAASGILAVLTLILFGFSYLSWSNQLAEHASLGFENRLFFNQSQLLPAGGELFALGLLAIGVLLLILRQPNSWGVGLAMFLLLGAGHLVEFIAPTPSNDYPGFVRLVQLVAYPLLFALPERFPLPRVLREVEAETPLFVERRNYSAETETFRAFMALTTERDPDQICGAFTRTISHILLADICFLVTIDPEDHEIVFECGYDLIREQAFPGTSFSEGVMPVLYAAMRRRRTLKLPASSTSPDLTALADALGLERAGHMLAVPIPETDDMRVAGVIVLSPYSNRAWTFRDEDYLIEASAALNQIALRNEEMADRHHEVTEAREQLQVAQEQLQRMEQDRNNLQFKLQEVRANGLDPDAAESMASLLAAQEAAQETIQQLESELEALQVDLAKDPGSPEVDQEPAASAEGSVSDLESVSGIARELQQPVESIIGYTDLLLSESAGILGTLQIKYLERIKASLERVRTMTDELVHASGPVSTSPLPAAGPPVELTSVIDDAIAFTRSQLSEKHIILRVDLPDHLPEVQADRDVLQQVLIHLLQNAGAVTPVEGKIALHARLEQNDHNTTVLLQVADSGGGIPEEDIPHVFSRIHQAERTSIQGIGDSGLGLAIAKSLVEGQNGEIWVDSDVGNGSTFSVLLPVYRKPETEVSAGGSPT